MRVGCHGNSKKVDLQPIVAVSQGKTILTRDWPVMLAVTFGLFLMAYGFKKPGHLTHWEGSLLLGCYAAYTGWLVYAVVSAQL